MNEDGDGVVDCDAGHNFVAPENLNSVAEIGWRVLCVSGANECLNLWRTGGKLLMDSVGECWPQFVRDGKLMRIGRKNNECRGGTWLIEVLGLRRAASRQRG